MRKTLALFTTLSLVGCAGAALSPAVGNLIVSAATVAVNYSTTAAAIVAKGATLCGEAASPNGQLEVGAIVMLANANHVPVSVTGQSKDAVAAACKLIGLIPGGQPPSVDPNTLPVVSAPTTLPAAV